MGIVVGPSYVMVDDIRSKRLVRLLADHFLGQMAVMMVYPSRRQLSAKVRSFIDFMAAHYPHPDRDPWCEGG
jgi:DNA-binding transcriptional LysR family regulator